MLSVNDYNSAISWFAEQTEALKSGWYNMNNMGYNTLCKKSIIQINKKHLISEDNEIKTDQKTTSQIISDGEMNNLENDLKDIRIDNDDSLCFSEDMITELKNNYDDEIIKSNNLITLKVEIQILYHFTYQVPVLYFNIHNTGGKLIGLSELWNILSSRNILNSEADFWSLITQQENPSNKKPFFCLHPCHTFNLMQHFTESQDAKKYFLVWLSTVLRYSLVDISTQFFNNLTISSR